SLGEADVRTGGCRLGPMGGRIVGEVLVGLLDLDPSSVRHAPESWKPSATLIDLLMGLDRVPVSTVPSAGAFVERGLQAPLPARAESAPSARRVQLREAAGHVVAGHRARRDV